MTMGFPNIPSFVAHLTALASKAERSAGLEEAARIIHVEAQAEIGHYQGPAGPFRAWKELADATKADRTLGGYPENEPLLREGDMRDSIERTVEGNDAWVGSDSDIAVYQELGTDTIPPRSFLGGAAVRKEAEVVDALVAPTIGLLAGGAVAKSLKVIG